MAKIMLEEVLKKKKMSKYEFGKLLGVASSNLPRYFKKGYDPRLSTVEAWAKVLKVSIKDLIED